MSDTRAETAYEVSKWLEYLSIPEVDALKKIVNLLPSNPHVINIGAGAGTSGLAIMEARPDVYLITIDKTLESHPYGCLEGERIVLQHAGFLPNAAHRYKQIHGDSKEVGKRWGEDDNNALADFVFVDGDHSYEGVRGDISIWLNNINIGGYIAVHDYKKIDNYTRKHEGEEFNLDTYRLVKPWFHVDMAVDALLAPFYEKTLLVDTLIAYRIQDIAL